MLHVCIFSVEDRTIDQNATNPNQEICQEKAEPMEVEEVSGAGEVKHDVPYFRSLLSSETSRLNALCDEWNKVNEETPDLTEDGRILLCVVYLILLLLNRYTVHPLYVVLKHYNVINKCTDHLQICNSEFTFCLSL